MVMTDKELIDKLQTLKQIKPRQDWVLLTKNQIVPSAERKLAAQKTSVADFLAIVFQRKFAYAFAVFLFLFVGLSGFVSFLPENTPTHVSSTAENTIKSDVETFRMKSQNLATVAKSQPDALPQAIQEVKNEAKSLTVKIQQDPDLAKEVALDISNSRTYLDVVGTEKIEETDDLYGALVDILLADAEKISWTGDQKATLVNIKELRKEGKNSRALEEYLLLSAGVESMKDEHQDESSGNSETMENNESVGENNSL